ncbi:glycine zipper 2TM domain-containing protein [Noviherbaspirillum sp. CPCC 100848]|uniref:Glycine zipper 2TM domain-containing protein n=1 Tax=Noviherbaspirillum album TaxID=3080276 RepID=A0ABU6J7I4_9BURK|nr:glycine zipper 2TM domain-containing protein [Noviherbaspirillum sp. CPCC 100848]MEC4719612.1 glycine zipper 2TM domain-containing protein [Noviherbaspirillum sp. CPCC 100848]
MPAFTPSRSLHTRLSLAIIAAMAASAVQAADFDDFARVVSVAPQLEQVNYPQQECWTEYVQAQRQAQRGVGGSIVGGLAGGILGNQVGGGSGRTVATAAGAIAGAIVGDRLENNQAGGVVEQQPVRQCRTIDNWQTRTSGYAVTYEYHGHTYTSVMPYDPGARMRVRVSVTPRP